MKRVAVLTPYFFTEHLSCWVVYPSTFLNTNPIKAPMHWLSVGANTKVPAGFMVRSYIRRSDFTGGIPRSFANTIFSICTGSAIVVMQKFHKAPELTNGDAFLYTVEKSE